MFFRMNKKTNKANDAEIGSGMILNSVIRGGVSSFNVCAKKMPQTRERETEEQMTASTLNYTAKDSKRHDTSFFAALF